MVGGSFLLRPRRMPADHLLLDLEANLSSIQQGPESSLESICIVGAIHSLKGKCHRLITGQGRKLVRRLSLYHLLSQRVHSKYCHLQRFPFLLTIMKISGGSILCKTPCCPELKRGRIQTGLTWLHQKEIEIIYVYVTHHLTKSRNQRS